MVSTFCPSDIETNGFFFPKQMFLNIFDKWEILGGSIGESHWFCFIASTLKMVETENDEQNEIQAEKAPSSFILCPLCCFL